MCRGCRDETQQAIDFEAKPLKHSGIQTYRLLTYNHQQYGAEGTATFSLLLNQLLLHVYPVFD